MPIADPRQAGGTTPIESRRASVIWRSTISWNSPKDSFWFWRLPHRFEAAKALGVLDRLQHSRADGAWLAASLLYRGDDKRRLARLHGIAAKAGVPLLATNEVLYHHPARRPLQDVLTCIREKTTIDAIGRRLQANAERYLKPAAEMARLFRELPEAIAETMRFAAALRFRSIN